MSKVEGLRSKVEDLGSKVEGQRSKVEDLGSKVEGLSTCLRSKASDRVPLTFDRVPLTMSFIVSV